MSSAPQGIQQPLDMDEGRPETRSALDLRSHFAALRRLWRSVLLCTLLGVAIAAGLTLSIQPKYETRTTFFVVTSAGTNTSPVQADEFAQRRINSYVGVVRSEKMASIVVKDTGLPIQPIEIQRMVTTSVDPETVLMNVTVTDISPDRSLRVATSIANRLDVTIRELENRGSRNSVQLRVISGPTLNPDPVSPREKLNLGLGLLLGLGVGIAQALLRYQLDNSFRSLDQLATAGVPALGVQHYDSSAKTAPVLPPRAHATRRSEAIRQLRTNLRFVHAAKPVRVLAITSSIESEGKSTLATNLAQSFAELGRRVLLVDADLRKPRISRLLDLEGSAGLTSVLIGEAKLGEVVQEWGPDALRVLTSGLLPPNPSELLASPAMNKFIAEARAEYEVIVIDTSPLLPVTDGAVAATQADGVIMLVRYGKTSREQVKRSLDILRSGNARILGTVLSMAPVARSERMPSYYQDPGTGAAP